MHLHKVCSPHKRETNLCQQNGSSSSALSIRSATPVVYAPKRKRRQRHRRRPPLTGACSHARSTMPQSRALGAPRALPVAIDDVELDAMRGLCARRSGIGYPMSGWRSSGPCVWEQGPGCAPQTRSSHGTWAVVLRTLTVVSTEGLPTSRGCLHTCTARSCVTAHAQAHAEVASV
jgi:hypothetical protein